MVENPLSASGLLSSVFGQKAVQSISMSRKITRGQDIATEFPGLFLIHQKIAGAVASTHAHDGHEIFLPLQGEIAVQTSDKRLVCGPGRLVYLPPKQPHTFDSSASGQGERVIAIVDEKRWRKEKGGRFPPTQATANQLFKELLFYLLLNPRTKNANSLVSVLIQTLSENLDVQAPLVLFEGKVNDPRVQAALELLRAPQLLPMDQIAKRAGLSLRSLNRVFLEQLGCTPKQVMIAHRIERARELLESGRHSVTDVALEVGYRSLSQFIETFRRLTGQLPSEVARRGM